MVGTTYLRRLNLTVTRFRRRWSTEKLDRLSRYATLMFLEVRKCQRSDKLKRIMVDKVTVNHRNSTRPTPSLMLSSIQMGEYKQEIAEEARIIFSFT